MKFLGNGFLRLKFVLFAMVILSVADRLHAQSDSLRYSINDSVGSPLYLNSPQNIKTSVE